MAAVSIDFSFRSPSDIDSSTVTGLTVLPGEEGNVGLFLNTINGFVDNDGLRLSPFEARALGAALIGATKSA